jgi:predicted lipoprotein with Yx(FWY)xxD motif
MSVQAKTNKSIFHALCRVNLKDTGKIFVHLHSDPAMPQKNTHHFFSSIICATACLLTACSSMPANTPHSSDMSPAINLNGTMVDSVNRQTLYTYDGDTHNHSNCTDEACIAQWLPFYAREHHVSRGDFSVFTRQDGRKQWALMGKPLYFRVGETHPQESPEQTSPEQAADSPTDPHWKAFRVDP